MSSTPGSRKSLRLNGPQDDPDAIHTALPDNNGASGLGDDIRRLNINAKVYRPPPPLRLTVLEANKVKRGDTMCFELTFSKGTVTPIKKKDRDRIKGKGRRFCLGF